VPARRGQYLVKIFSQCLQGGGLAYVAMRDDKTGLLLDPFQATRRGFRGMEPPQARPAQPTSLGTTIWMTTSYEE
jgi:hypothetical protein